MLKPCNPEPARSCSSSSASPAGPSNISGENASRVAPLPAPPRNQGNLASFRRTAGLRRSASTRRGLALVTVTLGVHGRLRWACTRFERDCNRNTQRTENEQCLGLPAASSSSSTNLPRTRKHFERLALGVHSWERVSRKTSSQPNQIQKPCSPKPARSSSGTSTSPAGPSKNQGSVHIQARAPRKNRGKQALEGKPVCFSKAPPI